MDVFAMVRGLLVGVVLAVGTASPATAGPLDDGAAAFERGDYATALLLLRSLAENGEAAAQRMLGTMYHDGKGVPRDSVEAARWFQKAASSGDDQAQFSLGLAYYYGDGVAEDATEAVQWLERAAEQGRVAAQTMLGTIYASGRFAGHDNVEAAKWYRRAARQRDAAAQFALGRLYYDGDGVPQDFLLAHVWISLAISSADDIFTRPTMGAIREGLVAKMTPDQVAEAQRLAWDCLSSNYTDCP